MNKYRIAYEPICDKPVRRFTYAIEQLELEAVHKKLLESDYTFIDLNFGVSVNHPEDRFVKKIGRDIAVASAASHRCEIKNVINVVEGKAIHAQGMLGRYSFNIVLKVDFKKNLAKAYIDLNLFDFL